MTITDLARPMYATPGALLDDPGSGEALLSYPVSRASERDAVDDDYADFVRARQQALLGFAHLLCGNLHDAQDLVQAALAKAYLKWKRLREDDYNVEAYVRKIIVNENASVWRRAWKRRERSTDELPERVHQPSPMAVEDATWDLVLGLPPRQRAVIALRFYEDLSVAETAAILHCSEGTVKSQTSRALDKLKLSLAAEEEDRLL